MKVTSLQFRTVIAVDHHPSARDAVRRALLIDAETGLPHELATAFVLAEHGLKRLNTQVAAFNDLAFFLEWLALRRRRARQSGAASREFINPEHRVLGGMPALTKREIADFCRWTRLPAAKMAEATREESAPFSKFAVGQAVKFSTSNRKIQAAGRYVAWLTRECDPREELSAEEHRALDASVRAVREAFDDHVAEGDDSVEVRSLDIDAKESFERVLDDGGPFSLDTPTGRRDLLMMQTMYESGLRPGELLKLSCTDVVEAWEYKPGQITGCLHVVVSHNDPADVRKREPSCKTLPGLVPITSSLASKLMDYITGDREEAVSDSGSMTPLLFVNHQGKFKGDPISQRNLNRVAAKLKSYASIPARFSPHVLRHTHFDHVYEAVAAKGQDPREVLIQRGRWSQRSTMPGRYAKRAIARHSAEFVRERERQIAP
jgi:site-specific recombinase XerD